MKDDQFKTPPSSPVPTRVRGILQKTDSFDKTTPSPPPSRASPLLSRKPAAEANKSPPVGQTMVAQTKDSSLTSTKVTDSPSKLSEKPLTEKTTPIVSESETSSSSEAELLPGLKSMFGDKNMSEVKPASIKFDVKPPAVSVVQATPPVVMDPPHFMDQTDDQPDILALLDPLTAPIVPVSAAPQNTEPGQPRARTRRLTDAPDG